jgi:long-chain acyl-CoA synthetase
LFKTTLDIILSHAETNPDKTAIVDHDGKTSYGELAEMIRKTASWFKDHGAVKGDRIMIAAVPFVRFVAAYFASHYIGALAVPVDKKSTLDYLEWIIEKIDCKLVLWEGDLVRYHNCFNLAELNNDSDKENAVRIYPDKDDVSDIIFTSATTGKPKGVMWTYANVQSIILTTINVFSINADTVWLIPSPMHHSAGLRYLYTTLYSGATVVLEDGFSSLKNIYNAIKQNNCTHMNCTPAAIHILYEQTRNNIFALLGMLKTISLGGMSMPLNMKKKLINDLPNTDIYNMFSATEAQAIIGLNYSKKLDKLKSIGVSFPGVNTKILDDDFIEINSDADNFGILALQSNTVMKGYWDEKELTDKTLVDNWLIMNDMAYKDDDGYLYLVGRKDDIINTGGEKVSLLEIDTVISSFEGIKECCCIAVGDNRLGSVPAAFITVNGTNAYSEKALFDYLNSRLAKYKIPAWIIVIGEMPRNSVGKILKRELIRVWEKGASKVP